MTVRTLVLRELDRYYCIEIDAETFAANVAVIVHNWNRSHELPRNSGEDAAVNGPTSLEEKDDRIAPA